MEKIVKEAGIEPENRARAIKLVQEMGKIIGCKKVEFVNVAEADDFLVKLFEPNDSVKFTARRVFAPLASLCPGVLESTIIYPSSTFEGSIEVHVLLAKVGKGEPLVHYEPREIEQIYLEERLKEKSGGRSRLPPRLLTIMKGIARDVISFSKPALDLTVEYFPGENKCRLIFTNILEFTLSFAEHLFEKYARCIVDIEFKCTGVSRELIIEIDLDTIPTKPEFHTRSSSSSQDVEKKKNNKKVKFE